MIAIDVVDLVVIAGRVLGVGPSAALAQVDLDAARAALAAAKPPEAELIEAELIEAELIEAELIEAEAQLTETGRAEPARAAVLLIRALLRHRPFPDQNERVAVAAARQFLALNGWRAVGEAVAQGHDYIGTEHILLGLFHAGDDTAARALTGLGAGEHEVRAAIIAVTGDPGPGRPVHHRRHRPGPRHDEIRRLRAEVARLSDLLRENGIEPGDGGRQTA